MDGTNHLAVSSPKALRGNPVCMGLYMQRMDGLHILLGWLPGVWKCISGLRGVRAWRFPLFWSPFAGVRICYTTNILAWVPCLETVQGYCNSS